MLPLIGILIVVVGFALRLNPLLIVATAAIATGLSAGRDIVEVISAFGKAFIDSRSVAVAWLALPVIGMLERAGLKERARTLMANIKVATTGRLLFAYMALRQITSALGLISLGGHPQMVRPLIAPMAEAAAENKLGSIPDRVRHRVRAHAAAADNIGLFFGEDIFIAIGSILLIRGFLETSGIQVEPVDLAVWAIPTAICAFVIHGTRILLLDRKLARMAAETKEEATTPEATPELAAGETVA